MSYSKNFTELRQKLVTDVFDEFPDLPNRTTARVLFERYPEVFLSIEGARDIVRYFRGKVGEKNLRTLTNKKYVRE